MAKVRLVKWTCDGNVLKVHRIIGEEAVIEAEFDMTLLFADFDKLADVQKQLIIYGTKQKLMDCGASEVGNAGGKIANAKKIWQRMLDGHFDGERINATGAKEDREAGKKAKELSKAVTLEGLVVKKTLYPATFTEEDEEKLQEFLKIAGKGKK
jgi:hypothetical protein